MLIQRTKGRLLLALLVVTGLAGTISDNTLTKEERKNAITMLKETKAKVAAVPDGLSEAQLNYRPAPEAWSIRECLTHIALSEKEIWTVMETGMKPPANASMRDSIKVTDAQILPMLTDRSVKRKAAENLQPSHASWTTAAEALTSFKALRNDHIKYVRSTTEDLRNHVLPVAGFYVDCYQMILFLNAHTERHYKQIEEVRASPGFPKS